MSRAKMLVNAHMREWFAYAKAHSDIQRAYYSVKRTYS